MAHVPAFVFHAAGERSGRRPEELRIGYQQPFTFLPGFWSTFDTQRNYTGVDSKNTCVGGIRDDLAGVSRSAKTIKK